MEVKIFSISTQSANIVFISLSLRKSVALSNFSQYFVSVVSFSAMEILEIKSALYLNVKAALKEHTLSFYRKDIYIALQF